MKLIKFIFCLFLLTIGLNGCQSAKDGLEGKRRSSNSDEFLVKKKNPLVMPPDYNSLPKPKKKGEEIAQEEDFELKKILGEDTNTTKNDTSSNTDGDSLEKSILKKINVN